MLKYRKTWYLLIPIMILAACAPKPVEITIEMDEFSFTPNEINLQVGQEVVLYLDNVGSIDHELMIGRDLKLVDGVPVGFEVDFFENAGVLLKARPDDSPATEILHFAIHSPRSPYGVHRRRADYSSSRRPRYRRTSLSLS